MPKLRARKAPVYKVVYCEGDGRLVSCNLRKSSRTDAWRRLARWAQRVYRDRLGRVRPVQRSFAFSSKKAALSYRASKKSQVWEATCTRAKRVPAIIDIDGREVCSVTRADFRSYAAGWGARDGWSDHAVQTDPGVLLCENLRLVRRLEP